MAPGSDSRHWASVEAVLRGWSKDRKFHVRTQSGESLLLRVSPPDRLREKEKEFRIIRKYSTLGFPMSMPLEFGTCEESGNVYMLLTWVSGHDLEAVLPRLSEEEQYRLGRQAGTILRKIHSLPPDPQDVPHETKRAKKLLQLERYEASGLRIRDDGPILQFVKDHIHLIWTKAPAYLHGDFHPGNLIYMETGSLGVIDFNRWEVGDPYEEFYKLESFGIESSVPYCVGQIDAYFADEIPEDFWTINAVYTAHASLWSIKWAEQFGQKEIDGMIKRAERAILNFDSFRRPVPVWYTDTYRRRYGSRIFPEIHP